MLGSAIQNRESTSPALLDKPSFDKTFASLYFVNNRSYKSLQSLVVVYEEAQNSVTGCLYYVTKLFG